MFGVSYSSFRSSGVSRCFIVNPVNFGYEALHKLQASKALDLVRVHQAWVWRPIKVHKNSETLLGMKQLYNKTNPVASWNVDQGLRVSGDQRLPTVLPPHLVPALASGDGALYQKNPLPSNVVTNAGASQQVTLHNHEFLECNSGLLFVIWENLFNSLF
eukprot:Gb_37268 [translate_table: standard]